MAALMREAMDNALRPPADWRFPLANSLRSTAGSPSRFRSPNNLEGRRAISPFAPLQRQLLTRIVELRTAQVFALLMAALRLHEFDHGALPATLDALVPKYLDAVPLDPWNDEPLSFDPTQRLVWSVGTNFRNEGGRLAPPTNRFWWSEPTLRIPPPRPME